MKTSGVQPGGLLVPMGFSALMAQHPEKRASLSSRIKATAPQITAQRRGPLPFAIANRINGGKASYSGVGS